MGDKAEDLSPDERDNAAFAPLGMVIDPGFRLGEGAADPPALAGDDDLRDPRQRLHQPASRVAEKLRGKYAGLASEAAIAHLKKLGVTAVELMPIHHFIQDRHLLERGLANYWGYNTLGFFAPEPRYAPAGWPHARGARVQRNGEGAAPRGYRGDSGRGL